MVSAAAETKLRQSLPHEVWLNIFELATFVPNAFDTHAPDLFAYPGPWPQGRIQEGIHEALCTKRRIVLVCKAWNMLASRMLYQSILISRPRALELILRSLREHRTSEESDSTSAEPSTARWTVRLDIALRRDTILSASDFTELLRFLPNLQIIVARSHFYTFGALSLLDVLAEQSLPSLKVLDFCANDRARLNTLDSLNAIGGFPLRVLRIRPPALSLWLGKRIALSELEFLDAPPQLLRSVFAGEIPVDSLTHMSLVDDYDAVWKVVKGHLSSVGGRLKSLEVDDGCLVEVDRHFNKPTFDTLLHRVAESCPSLHSLVINLKSLGSMTSIDYLPPVTKLGLRFHGKDISSKKWFKQLCAMLTHLIHITPSLDVIRIIGRPSLADLHSHHAGSLKIVQRSSETYLLEHGVRFEDWTGQLFHEV